MRLNAFSLIETIVSMLLVSITGSLIVLLIFRVYASVPSPITYRAETEMEQIADSLIRANKHEFRLKRARGYEITSKVQHHAIFDSVKVVTITFKKSGMDRVRIFEKLVER